MSLSRPKNGPLTLLQTANQSRAATRLSSLAADAIISAPNSYSVRVIAPEPLLQAIRSRVLRRIGKRRSESLRLTTFMQLLAYLRGAPSPPPESARRLLVEDLCRISDIPRCIDLQSIEMSVLEQESDPTVTAYLNGLRQLGYEHPYSYLHALSLPVAVQTVLCVGIDRQPIHLQSWLLNHLLKGVDVVASCADPSSLISAVPEGIETKTIRLGATTAPSARTKATYDDSVSELDAIVSACGARRIDTVLCANLSTLQQLELALLVAGVPTRLSPSYSLVRSSAIRAFASYLEFSASGNSSACLALFQFAGGRPDRWPAVVERYDLPYRLPEAALLSHRIPSETLLRSILEAVQSLILVASEDSDLETRIDQFTDWGSLHIDGFDVHPLNTLSKFVRRYGSDLTASVLISRVYRAISTDDPFSVPIRLVEDAEPLPSAKSWLALGRASRQRAEYCQSIVFPMLSGQVTVSHVANTSSPT